MSEDESSQQFVRNWMNPPEFTIAPDTSLDEAFQLLKREGIRHLLVIKDDDLVGIVTDRDLRRPDWANGEVMSIQDLYRLGDELRARDVMSDKMIIAHPNDTTAYASHLMVENKINCLPVVIDEKLVGILTSSDLLAALVHCAPPESIRLFEEQ